MGTNDFGEKVQGPQLTKYNECNILREIYGKHFGELFRHLGGRRGRQFLVMADGEEGVVIGGPVSYNGYQWWRIQYDRLWQIPTWSAEGEPATPGTYYLKKISSGTYYLSKPNLSAPSNAAPNLALPVTLSWNKVTDSALTGYRVVLSSNASNLPSDPQNVSTAGLDDTVGAAATSTQIPVGKLAAGHTYYWKVRGTSTNYGGTWSDCWNFTTAASSTPQVWTPIAYPPSGAYTSAVFIYLATGTTGAEVRYTLNGSEPTQGSTLYTGTPVLITSSTTLKVKGFKSGMTPSQTLIAPYTFGTSSSLAAPVFSPSGGSYSGSVCVSLSGPSGANIRYTVNGSDPTESNGFSYSSSFWLSSTTTVKARAFASGWNPSNVASASFTISAESKCSPPYFTPSPGDYPSDQMVEIRCDTPGAVIRYRTGSSNPTRTMGTIYDSPVPVTFDRTIRAIAYLEDSIESESPVVIGSYTITPPPPSATLACSPSVINRTISIGETNPSDTFMVWSTTGNDVKYSIESDSNWLSSQRFAGTATASTTSIHANYEMSVLTPGVFHGKLIIRDTNSANRYVTEIPVNLTVVDFPASIELNKASLNATITERQNAPDDSFSIRNAGGGILSYGLSVDVDWLSVSPEKGETSGETDSIAVHYLTSGLTAGAHVANILISGSQGLTKTIPVSLTVNPFGTNLPVISGISPNIGSVEGGQRVTIRGENLQNATSVMFDGIPATNLVAVGPTELRLTVPARETIGKSTLW